MKLRLQNFQSHVDTEIELAPAGALTVVTGPTDSGKTALIRGFRLVAYNEPTGDSYIRVGANLCRVTVTLDDGTAVIRERSRGGVNRYSLTKPGEQPQVFEGFGASVPLEIQQALNISEVQIGDLTIRPALAEQLDGPFLGRGVPATARAKVLGYLSGTDAVDAANKAVGTDLYRANREVERLEAELTANATEQQSLAWVEPFGRNLETLTSLHTTATAAEDRRTRAAGLHTRLVANAAGLLAAQTTVDRLAQAPRAAELVAAGAAAADRAHAAARLLERFRAVDAGTTRAGQDLVRLAGVPAAAERLARLEETASRLARLRNLWARLRAVGEQADTVELVFARRDLVAAAEARLAGLAEALGRREALARVAAALQRNAEEDRATADRLVVLENEVSDARGAYRDALISAGTCPTCGAEVDPERLGEVA